MLVFLIILGIVAHLLIDYFIAAEFYAAAVMKGHSERKYLWLPFIFGIIGYLLVIALPDKNATNNAPAYGAGVPRAENKNRAESINDSLPEL